MGIRNLLFATTLLVSVAAEAQILPSFGNSRTGATGMQFLKIAPDARAASMGGAYVAIANDVASVYWNPAGICQTDTGKVNVQASHTRYFGGMSSNFAGAVAKVGKLSYLGVSVFSMNYGTMDETTEFDPKGTGRTFSVSNVAVAATYAKVLTSSFSFGVNAKFANENFAGVNVNNVLFDLGLKYDIGVRHARFGVNFSNFGFNVRPEGDIRIVKFNGDQDINTFNTITVPGVFRVGAAFDPVHTRQHVLTVAGQLNHPTDNNETFSFGGEYCYNRVGYLRMGYEFGTDETYVAPTFGAGLKILRNFGGLTVDYGFLAQSRLGNIHRFTVAINIR